MRGRWLHNWIATQAAIILRAERFVVEEEWLLATAEGRDFVDLWACRFDFRLVLEVETSARHVLDNLAKARWVECDAFGFLCPDRNTARSVQRRLPPGDWGLGVPVFLTTLPTLRGDVARVCRTRMVCGEKAKKRGIRV